MVGLRLLAITLMPIFAAACGFLCPGACGDERSDDSARKFADPRARPSPRRFMHKLALLLIGLVASSLIFCSDDARIARFNELGKIRASLVAAGNLNAAFDTACVALDYARSHFGPEHGFTAVALNRLARTRVARGEYAPAESLYLEAISIGEKQSQSMPQSLANLWYNLGQLYYKLKRYDEAEIAQVNCLEIRTAMFGNRHKDVFLCENELGLVLRAQMMEGEALTVFENSLATARHVYEDDHPNLATAMAQVAIGYVYSERYQEAEEMLREALRIKRLSFGDSHLRVARSLRDLAFCLSEQGRLGEALPLRLEALRIMEGQNLRADDLFPYRLRAAEALIDVGKLDSARVLLEELESSVVTEEECSAVESAELRRALAYLHLTQGKTSEAESLYAETLRILEQTDPLHTRMLAKVNSEYADLLRGLGRAEEAARRLADAVTYNEECFGKDHPRTRRVRSKYVEALGKLNKQGTSQN